MSPAWCFQYVWDVIARTCKLFYKNASSMSNMTFDKFNKLIKNTCIFRTKNFIGVRYDAFARSILVMAHFVKPSQGAFLFIIAMPRVEHHGRSVLNAWWGFSSWTNVSRDGCQGCKEWQQNVNGLNKNTQQNGSESGFHEIQDSVH